MQRLRFLSRAQPLFARARLASGSLPLLCSQAFRARPPLAAARTVSSEALLSQNKLSGDVTVTSSAICLRPVGVENEQVVLSTHWLRDSCQCADCVSPHSGQKRFSTVEVPSFPDVKSAVVSADEALEVEWQNDFLKGGGSHKSVYPKELIRQGLASRWRLTVPYSERSRVRQLWDRWTFEQELRLIPYSDWISGGPGFWRGLADLHRRGLIFLGGVPQSEAAVVDIAEKIGDVQTTFYGRSWDVVSKPEAENVAYTSEFLGLHQDLMYFDEPPFVQLLHCLENSCDGGESIFSDIGHTAVQIEMQHRPAFEELARRSVYYHYNKGGQSYWASHPVIKLSGDRHTEYAWSPPFQDIQYPPMLRGAEDSLRAASDPYYAWLAAAKLFSDMVSAPHNVFEVKLQPGQCVIFDNRRILHGRREFNTGSGRRWLKGTYVSKQAFFSKLEQTPPDTEGLAMWALKPEVHEKRQVSQRRRGRPSLQY